MPSYVIRIYRNSWVSPSTGAYRSTLLPFVASGGVIAVLGLVPVGQVVAPSLTANLTETPAPLELL